MPVRDDRVERVARCFRTGSNANSGSSNSGSSGNSSHNTAVGTVHDAASSAAHQQAPPSNCTFASVDVIDIAGLVKGASLGRGLGNAFLHHISTVHVIFQVVRAFDDLEVVHVEGALDPVRDIEIITAELIAKDTEEMCKRIERAAGKLYRSMVQSQGKELRRELAILLKAYEWLVAGRCLRHCAWTEPEHAYLSTLQMWTSKPTCFLVNMSARDYADAVQRSEQCARVQAWVDANSPDSAVVPISVRFEQAALQCPPEAKREFVIDVAERMAAVAAESAAARVRAEAIAAERAASKDKKDKKDKGDKKDKKEGGSSSSRSASRTGSRKSSDKDKDADKRDKKDKKDSKDNNKGPEGSSSRASSAQSTDPECGGASESENGIPTAVPVVRMTEVVALARGERPTAAADATVQSAWARAVWSCALGAVWQERTDSGAAAADPSHAAAAGAVGNAVSADCEPARGRVGLQPRETSALHLLIQAGYRACDMVRVYLIGEDSHVKAAFVRRGTPAGQVSGLLHHENPDRCTAVQVYPWDAFVAQGYALDAMRKNNTRLIKTKAYEVQEGDILSFTLKPAA